MKNPGLRILGYIPLTRTSRPITAINLRPFQPFRAQRLYVPLYFDFRGTIEGRIIIRPFSPTLGARKDKTGHSELY